MQTKYVKKKTRVKRHHQLDRLQKKRQVKRSRSTSMRRLRTTAQSRLNKLRQQTILAVAVTTSLLLLWDRGDSLGSENEVSGQENMATQYAVEPTTDPVIAIEEATGTLREMLFSFYGILPKLLLAIAIFILAALLAKLARHLLARYFSNWGRTNAISTLVKIGLYFLAAIISLGIIAGDARAALGSVGLIGLALSWALQTPIESFTGWLMNSFHSYYRVGDRIEVGDVFGDVYKIDVLTTTVWEAGGPGKAVAGAQSTGALITFPNWEVLRSNIVNYSRDFPYVWDELTIGLANESDFPYAMQVVKRKALQLIGEEMRLQAQNYRQLLDSARLDFDVDDEPQVYLSTADSWTNLTVRYLVHARKRRAFSTQLLLDLSQEIEQPQHQGKIRSAYPRTEVIVQEGK
ncbi:MAG: mechanosensitive ion channel family protein [Oligoflexus sp.]